MPRVLFRVKQNNSRAVRSFQQKVTKFLYTKEVVIIKNSKIGIHWPEKATSISSVV